MGKFLCAIFSCLKFECVLFSPPAKLAKIWQTRCAMHTHRLEGPNGPSRLLVDHEQLILQLIITETGIYLHEIQERLHERLGARVSLSTLSCTLKFMGCTRQVICHIAIQRDNELRAKFMANINMYDLSILDKSGCDRRNSIRKYGYSVRGIRPVEQRLLVRGVRYSAMPVMSFEAIHDVYTYVLCYSYVGDLSSMLQPSVLCRRPSTLCQRLSALCRGLTALCWRSSALCRRPSALCR